MNHIQPTQSVVCVYVFKIVRFHIKVHSLIPVDQSEGLATQLWPPQPSSPLPPTEAGASRCSPLGRAQPFWLSVLWSPHHLYDATLALLSSLLPLPFLDIRVCDLLFHDQAYTVRVSAVVGAIYRNSYKHADINRPRFESQLTTN